MHSHPRHPRAPGCCLQLAGQRGEPHASQAPPTPEPPSWGSRRFRSVGPAGGSTVGPPGLLRLALCPGPQQWPADLGGRWGVGSAGGGEAAGASEEAGRGPGGVGGGTALSVPRSGLNPVGLRVSGRPSVHSRCCWPGERLPAEPWVTDWGLRALRCLPGWVQGGRGEGHRTWWAWAKALWPGQMAWRGPCRRARGGGGCPGA